VRGDRLRGPLRQAVAAARRPALLLALLAALAVPAPATAALGGGAIDAGFASCGQATGLVPRAEARGQFGYGAGADLAAQPDGKVVAAGPAALGMGATRFNTDGSLDTSFGGDGVAFIRAPGTDRFDQTFVTSVAVQPNGKVVVGGWLRTEQPGNAIPTLAQRFLIARFTASGEPDTTFSEDGLLEATPPGSTSAAVHDLAAAEGGEMIVAGQVDERFAVVRLRGDGSVDPAFGEGGVARVTSSARPTGLATAVVIRPDGRILAAGQTSTPGPGSQAFTVARFTAAGAPDPGFAGTGSLTETFDETSAASALAPLPDGRFYAVGTTVDRWGGDDGGITRRAAIVRYLEDGSRDGSFAGDGSVLDALGGGLYATVTPTAAAADAQGRLAIATDRGPLARYNPEGFRDAAFGFGGVLRIFDAPSGAALIGLEDGSLVLGGENDRQGTRPAGFEWGPAIMRLAGGGAALERAKGQPAACFLRVRNPSLPHLLRRGRVARYGKLLVGLFLTQPTPASGLVRATTRVGGRTFEVGRHSFATRYAGGTAFEIRVRKDAYRRLSRVRRARIVLTLTTTEPDDTDVSVARTLRR
jgi:uncharacterized delta-60 repeat protein